MLAEDIDAMLENFEKSRRRSLDRLKRRWKSRRPVYAISHGHATEDKTGEVVHIWGAGYTRKGRIRDVRVDLDQMGASRLYETLRNMGYGDE